MLRRFDAAIAVFQKEHWDEEWPKYFGRPEAKSNPRKFRGDSGLGLATPPLIAVYHVVNEWFVRVLERKFWPDYHGAVPLNDAADLFCSVAAILDHRYTPLHCKRIHDKNYSKLKIRY